MKNLTPKSLRGRSIDVISTRASFWAALAALLIILVFTTVTVMEERYSRFHAEERRLGTLSGQMARGVAAEMMVGDSRSLTALLDDYKKRNGLFDIEVLETKLVEEPTWLEVLFSKSQVTWTEKLPGISPPRYLLLRADIREKQGMFSGFWTLLWVCLPLFLFGVVITFRIQKDLHRSIVNPMQKLAKDPEAWESDGPWVAEEVSAVHRHLMNYIKERDQVRDSAEKLKIEASIGEVAAQVAHDIRSPLAALDMVAAHLDQIPEEKRVIIRTALSRIRDIANGLLEKHRSQYSPRPVPSTNRLATGAPGSIDLGTKELLSSLIDSLITEKRMQFRSRWGVHIEAPFTMEGYGLFAEVNSSDFKRVLSNLINNAVEAVGDKGRVKVELDGNATRIFVRIIDDGPGIPAEVLPKLMQRGETHGKYDGSGLGLYSAKKKVGEWGGEIAIHSKPGEGTTVEMTLPRAEAPKWFVSELVFPRDTKVVILDDDTTIHQIWDGRFESLQLRHTGIEFAHLSTADEFTRYVLGHYQEMDRSLFLVDFELIGSTRTGLDLIEELKIDKRSILVTSRFEEREIKTRCATRGIRMIPKSLAGFVPIRVEALSDSKPAPSFRL